MHDWRHFIAPDIAVVIPTFRRPASLAEALASVLSQEGVGIEVVVVDDDAEGSAEAVVQALADRRVSYRRMPQPTGGRPALVRNFAWPLSTAPLVHFLDDDDRVPAGHYERAMRAFAAHPGVGVVFGRVAPFGPDPAALAHERAYFERAARRARVCRWFGPRWGFAGSMLFRDTLLVCSAGMIRRACIAPLAGFDGELAVVEDVDFYARAIRRFGACFLDEVVLEYRIGPSLMHRPDLQPVIDDCYQRMFERYRREWGGLNFQVLRLFGKFLLH